MGPRADYICERCDPEGAHPFEAPVQGARCSACGRKKWLRRLWTASSSPAVVTGGTVVSPAGQRLHRMIADTFDAGNAPKEAARKIPALAVPVSQALPMLALSGIAVPPGEGKLGTERPALLGQFHGRTPRPGEGTMVDRDSKR